MTAASRLRLQVELGLSFSRLRVVRFAACASGLASGLALAVRPAGSAETGLRRSRVGPEDRFCEAVRNDLGVPLTLEGPTRTMRGVPARCL